MIKSIALTIGLGITAMALDAQDAKFTVEVSMDTVLLGNYFELKYSIENTQAQQFEAPDLSAFRVVGGPNSSSSMSIVNGQVSQSSSYTYYLEPVEIGLYAIPPAYMTAEDAELETPPMEIIVLPNPEGIIQQPNRPGVRRELLMPHPPKPPAKPKRPRRKF